MKTVIITGANGGIGQATAKKFLNEGWKVFGTSLTEQIDFDHENLQSISFDLTDPKSIENTTNTITKAGEKIDVLINCAGVALDSWDEGVNMDKVRETFEVNLFGLIDFTERILPIINHSGHIVNLSSRYGSFIMPIDNNTSIGYRMAKASLNMYTRFLAFRLKDQNITVSSVNPGWVKTAMGFDGATENSKPDREPEEPAQEIYDLATSDVESGQFWYKGTKQDW